MRRVRITREALSSVSGRTKKGTDLFTYKRNQISPLYSLDELYLFDSDLLGTDQAFHR